MNKASRTRNLKELSNIPICDIFNMSERTSEKRRRVEIHKNYCVDRSDSEDSQKYENKREITSRKTASSYKDKEWTILKRRTRKRAEKRLKLIYSTDLETENCSDEDWQPHGQYRKKQKRVYKHTTVSESSFNSSFEHYYSSEDSESQKNVLKSPKASQMSEYELMIQQKRQEKETFLASLQIDLVKKSLQEAVSTLKPKPLKTVKRSPSIDTENIIMRKSSRLEEKEASFRKSKEIKSEGFNKKTSVTVPFKKALIGYKEYENISEFDGMDYSAAEPYNDYVSQFKNMTLKENHITCVSCGLNALAIHPSTERILVCAGNKYGKIGFWNVSSCSLPIVFDVQKDKVSDLKFNPLKTNLLISSSYDGTLCIGDLEKQEFQRLLDVSEKTKCTSFDFLSSSTYLVSHKNGAVSIVDARSNWQTSQKEHSCHKTCINTVSVHPVYKSYFLTSDTMGIMRLWDLRKLQEKPLIDVQHHQKAIYSAYFSPLTGNSVLSTSRDNTICIFDCSNLGRSLTLQNKLEHQNYCTSICKATWLPNCEDTFIVGNMDYLHEHPNRMDIFNNQMENIFEFRSNTKTRECVFHPSLPILVQANKSGYVFVFTTF